MRVRVFMEVELNDATMLKNFGAERLQQLVSQGEIEKGLARSVTNVLKALPGCDDAECCVVPTLLGPGGQTASGLVKL